MPWDAIQKNGKWIVRNTETGEKVAEHGSKEEARAQVRALYANSSKKHTRG